MIKEVLTQKEADALLKMEKVRISHMAETFPEPGEKPITFDLKARQGSEKFFADAAAPASVGSPIHHLSELPEPALLVTVGPNHQAALEK